MPSIETLLELEKIFDSMSSEQAQMAMICTLLDYIAGKQGMTGADLVRKDLLPIMDMVAEQLGVMSEPKE